VFSHLLKQKFPIVLLFVGFILIVISFFKIQDITKLDLSANPSPIYPIFACGIVLIALSIVMFVLTETYIDWRLSKVRKEDNGYSIKVGRTDVKVHFGKIEDCNATEPACVVALPANEFFDDDCISDPRSALGAYIQNAFPEGINDIRKLVENEVSKFESLEVEKELGVKQKSYGIGKCVYLRSPLGSSRKILLVSVTTKRRGEGLKSKPDYLMDAMGAIQQSMLDNRLNELHVPVLGSGHGGMRSEAALMYMVLAISEAVRIRSWQNLRSVTIVVFQKDSTADPEIPKKGVKRILSFAASMFS
jgi:Domain of unknown function (DUF6430)